MSAQEIAEDLERRRQELLLKHAALVAEAQELAYEALAENNLTAKQKYFGLEDRFSRLGDEIEMIGLALNEVRARAATAGRDVNTVLLELFGGGKT
jgi:hypothetical protein